MGLTRGSHNNKSELLRIAIIGFGLVGLRHAEALEKVDGVQLCAVADPSDEQEQASAKAVPHFDQLDKLIENTSPDGVILATPTTLHATHARLCIDADIPVLIEKPLAINAIEGRAIVQHAQAKNVQIMVGHHRRFNPIIQKAHKVISEGQIGDVKSVHATCWFYKPDGYFDVAPWRKFSGAGPISVKPCSRHRSYTPSLR